MIYLLGGAVSVRLMTAAELAAVAVILYVTFRVAVTAADRVAGWLRERRQP